LVVPHDGTPLAQAEAIRAVRYEKCLGDVLHLPG
jgi:hypothetical protein